MSDSSESDWLEFSESMSANELGSWLKQSGIPQKFCDVFEGEAKVDYAVRCRIVVFVENYIDGMEFTSLTEEEIKSLVPPIGLVKKIIKLHPQNVSSN